MKAPKTDATRSEFTAWQEPLLDLLDAFVRSKRIMLAIILSSLGVSCIYLLFAANTYTASAVAVLLARDKANFDARINTSTIDASDAGSRQGSNSPGSLMLPPQPSVYTTIITSSSVLLDIAKEFKDRLPELPKDDDPNKTVKKLRRMITASSTEEGLITVEVICRDAQTSSDIASTLFAHCEKVGKSIERNLLLNQIRHFDAAYTASQERLLALEATMAEYMSTFGLIDTNLQAREKLGQLRDLGLEKDRLETELQGLRISYAEGSTEIIDLKARIQSIREQIERTNRKVTGQIGIDEFGSINTTLKRLEQKVRFERDLLAALSTKAEIFRIRADEPIGNIAIIQPASKPSRPSGPAKKITLGLTFILSSFVALSFALIRQQWEKLREDPRLSARVDNVVEGLRPNFDRKILNKLKIK